MGKNLTYISQLDGLTFDLYSQSVLPRLLEQVSPWARYCGGGRDVTACVACGTSCADRAFLGWLWLR